MVQQCTIYCWFCRSDHLIDWIWQRIICGQETDLSDQLSLQCVLLKFWDKWGWLCSQCILNAGENGRVVRALTHFHLATRDFSGICMWYSTKNMLNLSVSSTIENLLQFPRHTLKCPIMTIKFPHSNEHTNTDKAPPPLCCRGTIVLMGFRLTHGDRCLGAILHAHLF